MASEEQTKADESVMKLAEDQKVSILLSILILLFNSAIILFNFFNINCLTLNFRGKRKNSTIK